MILERILSDNEKIRRAEEIYYRRNGRNINVPRHEYGRTKTYLGSKIMLEMLILVLMAVTVFAIKNKDYIFTQNFLNNFAKYNINFTEKFNSFMGYFSGEENSDEVFVNSQPAQNSVEPATAEENTQAQPQQNQQQNNVQIVQTQSSEFQQTPTEQVQEQSQQQSIVTDAQSLKNSYNMLKPLEGVVTSGFGARESKYQKVTGEHKGIDIGADSGTKINAAMSGLVTQVSGEGDYGKHLRITKNNVTTLYAHCQEIFVVEGQEITEGQEIASVGSTGNSTGPHLHFEIRIDDNPINPAEVIEF